MNRNGLSSIVAVAVAYRVCVYPKACKALQCPRNTDNAHKTYTQLKNKVAPRRC